MITKKHIIRGIIIAIVLLVVIIQTCYWAVALCTKGRIFNTVDDTPYNDVGMVLGAGPTTITGKTNAKDTPS